MAKSLAPPPKFTVYYNGAPASGAKVYTYLPGTTTPVDTYSTSGGTVNANPVICDSRGECSLFLTPGTLIDLVVKTSADVSIYTQSNVGVSSVDGLIGTKNIGFGTGVLSALTTGVENTALGYGSLGVATVSSYNTAVGSEALFSLTLNQLPSQATGGNTAVGRHALYSTTRGQQNVAVGINSMLQNIIGDDNVAIGVSALENAIGDSQVAIGPNALKTNTNTGFVNFNVAVGAYTQEAGATGVENVSVGYIALRNNLGDYNVAIGSQSMVSNAAGYYNTAVGWGTLTANTTGGQNTAVGYGALTTAVTSDNTGIGYAALNLTTGARNTALGRSAGSTLTTGADNILIGYNAQPSAVGVTGECTIGNTSLTMIRSQAGLALAGTFAVPLFNLATTGQVGIMTTASSSAALGLAAGTTAIASLRIPHGAAPTSPVNGDMWTTTAGLYVRINGATVGPLS